MQNNQTFFSIVIPVYNGLSHDLHTCLNSIWNQPIEKPLFEVICVDDCSTDDTLKWLKKQQMLHGNMKIVENRENIRQGGARNRGVEIATGKYIMFIDQDDYYHKDAFQKLHNVLAGSNLDILATDSSYQFKGSVSNELQLNLRYQNTMTGEIFLESNGLALIAPWRMIINREFYQKSEISFVEKTRIEDVDWAIKVLLATNRIKYEPILLIHYIKAEIGTTDTMYKNSETIIANIGAANRVLDILMPNAKLDLLVREVADNMYKTSCKYMLGLFSPIKEKKEILSLIPITKSKFHFVNFAINNKSLFSFMSNILVPFFRITRKGYRYIRKNYN